MAWGAPLARGRRGLNYPRGKSIPTADLKKLRDEITVEANEVERAIRQLDRKTGGEEQIKGLETRLTSAKTDLVRLAPRISASAWSLVNPCFFSLFLFPHCVGGNGRRQPRAR